VPENTLKRIRLDFGVSMKNEIIKFNPKEMTLFAEEAGKFIFKPSAESSLLKLHQTIMELQALEDHVKEEIGRLGKELNPNFKGVIGENIKCIYRKFGAKYNYDWKNREGALPFLKRKEYFSVDADKVDKYLKEVKELPEGIFEAPRDEKLSITYGKDEDEKDSPVALLD
jgi:hypothetical protein